MRTTKRKNKIPAPFGGLAKRGYKGTNVLQNISKVLTTILNNASKTVHKQRLVSDAASVVIKAASLRSSIHGARKRMKRGKSRRQIARVLEGLDLNKVEDETNSILRIDAKKRFGGQIIDAAIDIHEIPYHGGPNEDKKEIGRDKQKDGTTKFHMIATIYLIGKKRKRFTLAVTFVPLGTTKRAIVQTLLYLLRGCGIKVRILLLDKGFYSIEVVRLLMRLNIGFIMPMRGNRLKKKKGCYKTTYLMKSAKDGKPISQLVAAVSVIKYNRGKRFKHHGAMQLCFITGGIDFSLHKIAEFYRKRFGIESSYKLDKSIRPRTSSRNPAIRMFLFNAALLMQNFWVVVKQVFCKRICRASERMITLRDFADLLLHQIRIRYGEKVVIGT
jgi:putative transposase